MYLANLGSADPAVWRRSVEVLTDEVERCAQLGIGRIVTHPGSAGTATPEEGLKRIRAGLVEVAQRTAGRPVVILLEMMAGTGAQAGRSLEQLAWLIDRHPNPERLGLCLDTAHAFASGYPLHEPDGLAQLLDEIERRVGLNKLGCLHLNDSLKPFASRVDRHARIGHGELGRAFFARVLAESRLFGVPKILEVPGGDIAFREDLRLLARLARAASAGRQ